MLSHARRWRPILATRLLAGGVLSRTPSSASVLLAFSYCGYGRLVDEQQVSRIEFSQTMRVNLRRT